jgi:hypothetical protein
VTAVPLVLRCCQVFPLHPLNSSATHCHEPSCLCDNLSHIRHSTRTDWVKQPLFLALCSYFRSLLFCRLYEAVLYILILSDRSCILKLLYCILNWNLTDLTTIQHRDVNTLLTLVIKYLPNRKCFKQKLCKIRHLYYVV